MQQVYIGDDYLNADGRALSWSEPSVNAWIDLTSATVSMVVTDKNSVVLSTVSGTITNPDGVAGTKNVRFDYSATETNKLTPGSYHVRVTALKSGHHVTLFTDSITAV